MKVTISKTNTLVNLEKGIEYYDYNNYKMTIGEISKYKVVQIMGRGKYSLVFEGKDQDGEKVVIKTLNPVKLSKINREIMVLKQLDHKNIIPLREIVYDPDSERHSLIFSYIEHEDITSVFEKLNLGNIRFYCRQMLEALQYSHSMGIIHRDIKPQNMIIGLHTRQLKILDWGLAEFYLPECEYSVRVASRYYKSPELLVGYPYYDYSLDIWSFGCILAELLFKKRPFFFGAKAGDQIIEIAKVLGKSDLKKYLQKYEIPDTILENLKNVKEERSDLLGFIDSGEYHLIEDGVDLLNLIFVYDHQLRPTAEECLAHRYFN